MYFKDLPNNLMCLMQMRYNGVEVQECPKHCKKKPATSDHTISIADRKVMIPLDLHGVTSYFPMHKPNPEEVNLYNQGAKAYELTAAQPEWDPESGRFACNEAAMSNPDGSIRQPENDSMKVLDIGSVGKETPTGDQFPTYRQIAALSACQLSTPVDGIEKTVTISSIDMTDDKSAQVRSLVKNWGIGIPLPKRTILSTTQRAVRTWSSHNVERRYPSGDRNLRYR